MSVLSIFRKIFGKTSESRVIRDSIGTVIENFIKSEAGTGMTAKSREEMDYQADLNNQLAENDYDRKVRFYEQFESPEAQVRQYQNAGLNPALMYGSGASVSASGGTNASGVSGGSDGTGFANLIGLITGLAGLSQKQQQIDNDYKLRKLQLENDSNRVNIQASQSQQYIEWLKTQGRLGDQAYDFNKQRFPIELDSLKYRNRLLIEQIKTEPVQRMLAAANIDKSEAETAVVMYDQIIHKAMADRADEYYRLANQLNEDYHQIAVLQASGIRLSNSYEYKTLKFRVKSAEHAMNDLLFQSAIHAKDFESYGSRRIQSWIDTGANVVGKIGSTIGMIYGAGALKSGAGVMSSLVAPRYADPIYQTVPGLLMGQPLHF